MFHVKKLLDVNFGLFLWLGYLLDRFCRWIGSRKCHDLRKISLCRRDLRRCCLRLGMLRGLGLWCGRLKGIGRFGWILDRLWRKVGGRGLPAFFLFGLPRNRLFRGVLWARFLWARIALLFFFFYIFLLFFVWEKNYCNFSGKTNFY